MIHWIKKIGTRGEPMGELYDPFPKLPKNIRQIGERDQIVKLYVEDYVNTYLKRLHPTGGQDLRVGLLLGSVEMNDGTPYIFIDGAMEMENVTEEGQKVVFSELAWKKAYQGIEQLFPKRTIQGWFLCGVPGNDLSPLNYWKQHVQYFQGPNKLMYLNNGIEGDETVYITSEDGFYKLRGYSIYYERNQMMQDYMVLRKDVKRIETASDDKVIHEFRKRMDEHKDEAVNRSQTIGLMRGLSTAMAIVILAGGIVMFNNYQKMREMESVIASALPESAQTALMGNKNTQNKEKTESSVIVEEAEGGVYPTQASITKETLSETKPEGQNGDGQPAGSAGDSTAGGAASGQGNGTAGTTGGTTGGSVSSQGNSAAGAAGGTTSGQGNGAAGAAGGTASGQGNSTAGTVGGTASGHGNGTAGAAGGTTSGQGNGTSGPTGETTSNQGNSSTGSTGGTTSSQPAGSGSNGPSGTTGPTTGTSTGSSQTAAGTSRIHIVEDGETLYGICIAEYQSLSRLEEICELNGLEDENKIISGQKLLLP